jgi:peptidoglycan L-alanyl-D-glutamate endopeptidase CwlK
MISSRKLDDLLFPVKIRALEHIHACRMAGIELLVISTYRDIESQDAIFAQGRTAPGKIVTNARGGQSFHNWRVAYDCVPLRHGKPVWGTAGADGDLWRQVGELGEAQGLEWAGHWKRFREFPHFQFTGGLTLADFQAGKTLPKEFA